MSRLDLFHRCARRANHRFRNLPRVLATMHAAIVDPSGVVRRLTAELLTQRGDDVSLFSDAAEALECLRNEPSINLLITSLEVTPISGLELCWHARLAAGPSRPLHILVMS